MLHITLDSFALSLALIRYSCCHADLASHAAVFAQMVPPPSTTAAAQNSVQNTLQNAPLSLQEAPEKVLIAVSLIAVATIGYLLREKAQKEK